MNRLTKWDDVRGCYVSTTDEVEGRSIIQELGVYEDIHESDIKTAAGISDIRDRYVKKSVKLDPYWEKFGRNKGGTTF